MKIPRDLSGADLVNSLRTLGYENVRQGGSHIRLSTQLTIDELGRQLDL